MATLGGRAGDLINRIDAFEGIPGTVEYERVKREIDNEARGLSDSASDPKLTPIRAAAERRFPDISVDPRYILHNPTVYKVARTHQDPIRELLPTGYFTEYMDLTCGSLNPAQYDFMMALNCLGAWMGRRGRINIADRYSLWPPSSCLLISMNPGLGKGQALKTGMRMLRMAGYSYVAPDRVSASKFLGILYEYTQADLVAPSELAIMASELSGFFRDSDQATQGLIMDLADLMDMPDKFEYATRRHNREDIRLPTVSMVGCSNMDWLTQHMPPEAFTGGWIPRQYVSVMSREDAPKLERDYAPPYGSLARAVDRIKSFNKDLGYIHLTPEAIAFFMAMRKRFLTLIKAETDERKASFYDRRPTNTLRMAMLFAMSQDRRAITSTDVERADGLMTLLEETHYHLYNNIGLTLYGRWKQVTYELIRRTRDIGLTRQELKANLNPQGMKMSDLDGILEDLVDSDLIVTGEPSMVEGKPRAYIRAVDPEREINQPPRKIKPAIKREDVKENNSDSLTNGEAEPILVTGQDVAGRVTGPVAVNTRKEHHVENEKDRASKR